MICPACFQETFNNGVCASCDFVEDAPQSPLLLPPGTALMNGQYLVGKVLGRPGGFGITYLGWDSQLATYVAIKEYLPRDLAGRHFDRLTVTAHTTTDSESFRYGMEQFLHEARTLAQFDHPNVVRVRAFFQENGTAYLVMDYLQGSTLSDHLSNLGGRMPESAALDTILPVLTGLGEVHAKGFLHRDIKPQNIYITSTGRPILLDFGTARQAMGNRGMTTVITPGYAPWEQYHRHGKQGPWTDIYACAATLYHLVTGTIPPEAADRVAQDDLQPPAQNTPGLSAPFSNAVMKALSIDPASRPQTVAEFQNNLTGKTVAPPPILPVQQLHSPPPVPQAPQSPASLFRTPPQPVLSQQAPPSMPPLIPQQPYAPVSGQPAPTPSGSGGGGRKIFIGVGIVIALLLGGFAFFYNSMNGHRTISYQGGTYDGNVAWGSPSGTGKLTYANGSVYVGDFASGARNGQGTLKTNNGDLYEGDWKSDLFDGAGKLTLKDGIRYEGSFKQGKRTGNGTQIYPNGNQYSGAWQDDKKNGAGTLTQKDGTKYTGAFKDDMPQGDGTLKTARGDEYAGHFDRGQKSGEGAMTYSDGRVYKGSFANDKRNGQGTLTWPNGSYYTGGWKDDKRNGRGTQALTSNGSVIAEYVGEYRDDIPYSPNGQYKVITKDGRTVNATFRDNVFYW